MKYKSSIILLFFSYALNINEEQENIQYFIVLSKTSVAKVSLSQNHVFYVLTLYYNDLKKPGALKRASGGTR
jgi:hypothetical protein